MHILLCSHLLHDGEPTLTWTTLRSARSAEYSKTQRTFELHSGGDSYTSKQGAQTRSLRAIIKAFSSLHQVSLGADQSD